MTPWILRATWNEKDGISSEDLAKMIRVLGVPLEAQITYGLADRKKIRKDSDGDLICPECGRPFINDLALAVHRARVHGVKGKSRGGKDHGTPDA